MKNMILTSSLYESIELVKKFLDKNTESKKILFIPTATNVDEYKKYIYLTQKAFEDFGYEVENFDVSIFSEKTIPFLGVLKQLKKHIPISKLYRNIFWIIIFYNFN